MRLTRPPIDMLAAVIGESQRTSRPADGLLHNFFRENPKLGARDRAVIAEGLFGYLRRKRSLEATARELFVHPNTVRYRLKRVSEVIGWDATGARESLILQAALILGSIAEPDATPRRRRR